MAKKNETAGTVRVRLVKGKDSPQVRGLINTVYYLVQVEE